MSSGVLRRLLTRGRQLPVPVAALALVVSAVALSVAQPSPASASAPLDGCTADLAVEQRAAVAKFRAVDDQAAVDLVDARLRKLRDSGLAPDTAVVQVEREFCLDRTEVPTTGPSTMASTPGNVDVRPPSISYDRQAGRYLAIGVWDWLNQGYRNDGHCRPFIGQIQCSRPQGGNDGYGISFNTGLLMSAASISVRGDCYYGWLISSAPQNSSSNGFGWEMRDDVYYGPGASRCNGNNDFDTQLAWGQEVITFRGTIDRRCRNVQAFSAFSHTWDKTAVTGISFGVNSVGFQWSTTSNRWVRASQPGNVYRVC